MNTLVITYLHIITFNVDILLYLVLCYHWYCNWCLSWLVLWYANINKFVWVLCIYNCHFIACLFGIYSIEILASAENI